MFAVLRKSDGKWFAGVIHGQLHFSDNDTAFKTFNSVSDAMNDLVRVSNELSSSDAWSAQFKAFNESYDLVPLKITVN